MAHVDFEAVSRWVLGPHWRRATPAQREAFVDEFRELSVRTYSSAIRDSAGVEIEYLPATVNDDGTDATVPTRVPTAGPRPMEGTYRLHRAKGEWNLYDIIVDGVSLLITYRQSFTRQANQIGIDGLIRKLAEKNA